MSERETVPARVASVPAAPIRRPGPALLAIALIATVHAAAAGVGAQQPFRPPCTTPAVQTAAGAICGTTDTTTVEERRVVVPVYRGIPYAQAPTPANNLRWKPTRPLARQDTTIRATAFGQLCPQSTVPGDTTGTAPLPPTQSEDCLFLNVWTPPGASPGSLPVMVFIHGGVFVIGSGSAPIYNGAYLAAADTVVVVTLNYRLGALGFLYSMESGNQVPGNLGLLDQQTALRWVRRNIRAFGGDSGRVTIFGESAGAMSVGFHLFSMPSSDSLFRAAIMESNPFGAIYRTTRQAQSNGTSYIQDLCRVRDGGLLCETGVTARRWFNRNAQRASAAQVFAAQRRFEGPRNEAWRVLLGGLPQVLPWTPTVDGRLVRGQPLVGYAPGMRRKPFVFGFNRDEGVPFGAVANGVLTALAYDLVLNRLFGSSEADAVREFASGAVHPYDARRDTSVAGMGLPASALSNVVTDMVFKCASLVSADSGYAQNQRPAAPDTARPPVFGYLFQRSPIPFIMYPGLPECSAESGTVCHAEELPYVFNTLEAADTAHGGGAPIRPEDRSVARQMAAAWGSFAKRPTQPPAPGWTPYTRASRGVYNWSGIQNGPVITDLANTTHCSALWFTLYPLRDGSLGEAAARLGIDPARAPR